MDPRYCTACGCLEGYSGHTEAACLFASYEPRPPEPSAVSVAPCWAVDSEQSVMVAVWAIGPAQATWYDQHGTLSPSWWGQDAGWLDTGWST